MNREAVYCALFTRLSNIEGVVFASRRLQHWGDVPASQQPALFCTQGNQNVVPGDPVRGLPAKHTLTAEVYIYARNQGDSPPAAVLNPIIDAVCKALLPDNPMTRCQTLGGLVERCWIEGEIQTDEGVLGDQAVAIIPIVMLLTQQAQ